MENDAENKANQSSEKEADMQIQEQSERAAIREKVTLKIWDVPVPMGNQFVSEAKKRFGGKSWLYLKHLMETEMTSDLVRTKLDLIHTETKASNDILQAILEAKDSPDAGAHTPADDEANNPVRTFGGGKMQRTPVES